MAGKFAFSIQGNDFLITDDVDDRIEFLRFTRDKIRFDKTASDKYSFKKIRDDAVVGNPNKYAFLDIIDATTGLAFISVDALNAFLSVSLGSLASVVLAQQPTGITGFFLAAKGEFGTGAGWADSGFINDIPVLLFATNSTERSINMFFAISTAIFDNIDPLFRLAVWSTAAPAGGSDGIRWQLDCKYIAFGESSAKPFDQVLVTTQTLTFQIAETLQSILEFTLDRTLIENGDVMQLVLSRIGGDPADTYAADIGVGQAGILIETTVFNP